MKAKQLIFVPFIAILLSGCNPGVNPTPSPSPSPDPEPVDWEKTYVDDRSGVIDDYNGYYASETNTINYEDRGNRLKSKIHNLMVDTHDYFPTYSIFKETATYKKTAYNPSTNKIVYFYTGKEVSSYGGSREHVWPCANSNGLWDRDPVTKEDIGEDYQGAGADMYHLMPCTTSVNSARGNAKFTEFDKSTTYNNKTDGGPYALKVSTDKKRVELADSFKGDAARIICYLWVHYSTFGKVYEDHPEYIGNLLLRDIIDAPAGVDEDSNIAIYKTLAKWNAMDPVDEMEKRRNTEVEKVQHNRNPFIDHPEFVWKMFNLDYDGE